MKWKVSWVLFLVGSDDDKRLGTFSFIMSGWNTKIAKHIHSSSEIKYFKQNKDFGLTKKFY